jgi:hypothetical protein
MDEDVLEDVWVTAKIARDRQLTRFPCQPCTPSLYVSFYNSQLASLRVSRSNPNLLQPHLDMSRAKHPTNPRLTARQRFSLIEPVFPLSISMVLERPGRGTSNFDLVGKWEEMYPLAAICIGGWVVSQSCTLKLDTCEVKRISLLWIAVPFLPQHPSDLTRPKYLLQPLITPLFHTEDLHHPLISIFRNLPVVCDALKLR